MGDTHGGALGQIQLPVGLFAKTQLAGLDNVVIIDHVEYGDNVLAVVFLVNLYFAQSLEAFTAIEGAVTMQIGDVFFIGVDGDAAQL